jgi:hypothetical protein
MLSSSLYIGPTPSMGLGVFTRSAIPKDQLIEESPVIVMSGEERRLLDQTRLYNYIFEWGENSEACCMALGYIAMYNHSYASNCEYEMDFDAHTISIRTIRAIAAGEQLFINYNGDWDDTRPVWFPAE